MATGDKAKIWLYGVEACRELRVSPQTLGAMVDRGFIGVLDLPGGFGRRYSASDVQAIVSEGTSRRPAREMELAEA